MTKLLLAIQDDVEDIYDIASYSLCRLVVKINFDND